ncbi:hypothetical protein EPI10_010478 [Gossypium australe]|uniref:Retrotransposon gag domain-containing protein n=1 Tax=Gossypium australe TaxID=47621 RepID=A0A5B6W3Q5_9ROSI|nr:hypothetical protein EPI10_010478 [Gossypium australe]
MQEQLAKIQQDMRDQMLESQRNMISQLTQLLTRGLEKGKSPMVNPGDDNKDPTYLPGFTPTNIQSQLNAHPQRVSVNIRPQYQTGTSAPTNFSTGSGSNPGDNPTNPVVPDLDDMAEIEKTRVELPKQLENRCRWLEEKFRAMENADYHYGIDAMDLSLIHCFQDSLIRPAAKWYNQLSHAKINSWNDLAQAFMKQYSHVKDMTPDKITLQNIEKKQNESFRQYAQRWREVATELYQSLFDAHVVSPFYIKPMQPPFPKWYDANAQYEYHARITRHSIENYIAFKKLIERFIKMGIVKFDDPSRLNVAANLLPSHSDKRVNAIIENGGKRTKMDIKEVKTPLKWVWKKMVESRLITQDLEEKSRKAMNYCEFYDEEGHEIQRCSEFNALVQEKSTEKVYRVNHPVVIISRPKINKARAQIAPRVIIQKPVSFPYKDCKRVPWNYDCNVLIPGEENPVNTSEEGQDVDFYTCCGMRYNTPNTKVNLFGDTCDVLMKVLNETYVANDISVNKLDRLVNNISANNFIFFNDDEIPPRGMRSTKALHITTRCKGYTLPAVLIDNGSALNLKLVTEGRLVTINVEEDIIAFVISDTLYVGTNDEAIECSFRSLEFVNATFIVEGNKIPMPKISQTTRMDFRIKRNYLPERGLPREETAKEMLGSLNINAISKEKIWGENLSDICPYVPGSVLNNWTVKEIPVVFRANTESPDINDMSDAATNSESPFERDMDLNKASLKDNFSLPHIDTLVDNMAGYSLSSFMDDFSGYNQIKMHPKDMDNTTFVTMWGIFCYKIFTNQEVMLRPDLDNPKIETVRAVSHNLAHLKVGPSKVVKRSTIAYFSASRALEDYELLNYDFPNEYLMYVAITEEDSQEGHPWKVNLTEPQTLWVTKLGQSWYPQMEIIIPSLANWILIARTI